MTISEQIKVLCVRSNISVAELARRMGTTPQNFNSKMKRESFTVSDLEYLAETVGCSFERHFVLPDGENVVFVDEGIDGQQQDTCHNGADSRQVIRSHAFFLQDKLGGYP